MRIVEESARQRHHVSLAAGHDHLRLLRACNHSNDTRRDPGFAANLLGKRNVVPGIPRHTGLPLGTDAAGGDVDIVEAGFFQRLGERDRINDGEAAIKPIASGEACAKWRAAAE